MPDQSQKPHQKDATASYGAIGISQSAARQLSSSGKQAQEKRKEGKARAAAAAAAAMEHEKKATKEGEKTN